MNLFGTDFIEAFRQMLKDSLRKVIQEIMSEFADEDKFLMNRKEIAKVIGCDVDTFDEEYRYRTGFPYHKKGKHDAWNKKEVFEYLHKNKLIR